MVSPFVIYVPFPLRQGLDNRYGSKQRPSSTVAGALAFAGAGFLHGPAAILAQADREHWPREHSLSPPRKMLHYYKN